MSASAAIGPVPDSAPDGPVGQSLRIGLRVLQAATLLLALTWLAGNVRQVPPAMQAVVLRFGRIVSVQQSGLVLAWPRPFEHVVLLPAGAQQMHLQIDAARPGIGRGLTAYGDASAIPPTAGPLLTGDSGVVLLDAVLTWRISDAAAYYVAQDHIAPALRRLFLASAVAITAARPLDDMLAVRPERANDPTAEAQRAALRGDLVASVNRRLAALAAAGSSLGVEVTRADVTALLPPVAKLAFDAVLEASQRADQGIASARTDAERARQGAVRDTRTILDSAHAAAAERLSVATSQTAAIRALESHMDPASRPSLLDQAYRERIVNVLRQAGTVTTLDLRGQNRLILPATTP